MKKYTEVLNEKRTPLTGEDLKGMEGLADHINYTADSMPATLASMNAELLAEVKHLREMMATAYHWIGRPAPKNGGLTRAYMGCLREAQRIHGENKEMKK